MPLATQLAWFAYVLSISGALDRPDDFPSKALIAYGAEGAPGSGVLLFAYAGSKQVAEGPYEPGYLLGKRQPSDFDQSIAHMAEVAERLADEGSSLIPAVRAARESIDWGG